jgi:hypothetical protein
LRATAFDATERRRRRIVFFAVGFARERLRDLLDFTAISGSFEVVTFESGPEWPPTLSVYVSIG